MKKLLLTIGFAVALIGSAFAQQGAFPNYPIVGSPSYCSSTTNGSCTNTVPAGPTAITGNEQIPANTELPNGQSPQNVLIPMQILNGALPINWVTAPTSFNISASNLSGGVVFISGSTIGAANVTLPLNAFDSQQYRISSNRTVTALGVFAPAGDTLGTSASPTVITASTTVPYGYNFVYHKATKVWQRLQ